MTLFPSWFLVVLVHGGVILAALGAIVLLGLFVRDLRRKTLW